MSSKPDFSGVDFGADTPAPSSDKLQILTDLVGEMERTEVALEAAQAVVKQHADRLKGLLEHEIPDLMLELKQPILHTSDGRKIEVKDVVRASLPEAMRPLGHQWLIDNGHAGVVKRTVEVAFAAVEGEAAKELLGSMEKEYGANARQVMKVESSTLTSFVKKQLAREAEDGYDGPQLPREVFTVREFQHAKVTKGRKG